MRSWKANALLLLIVASDSQAQTFQWPVSEPRVTQDFACHGCFGLNADHPCHEGSTEAYHSGIDIQHARLNCATTNVDVFPVDSGIVRRTVTGCGSSDPDCGRGLGNHVIVEHPDYPGGVLYSVYGHLQEELNVSVGDPVFRNTPLGVMGDTGGATACHVHLGFLDFHPPHLGPYNQSTGPMLEELDFCAYPETYPSADCNLAGGGCPDPRDYLASSIATLFGSGSLPIRETPFDTSCLATQVEPGQSFNVLDSYTDAQANTWLLLTLPHPEGPTGWYEPPGCDPETTYGWLKSEGGFSPLSGNELVVKGEAVGAAGAPVFFNHDGAIEITRTWGGQHYWSEDHETGPGCVGGWFSISVPPDRGDGNSTVGWICAEHVHVLGPGQCSEFFGEGCGELPTVATLPAGDVEDASAQLNMTVNPGGLATTAWFEWRESGGPWVETAHVAVGAGASTVPVSATVGGLDCETPHSFKAVADNSAGPPVEGAVLSFTTTACGGGGTETVELILNGDFLDDDDHWALLGDFYADRRFNTSNFDPGYAYLSEFDGTPGNNLLGAIYQQVTVPANAESALLRYWVSISTSEPDGGPAQDFLNATLQDEDGNFLAGLEILSNQHASGGSYVLRQFNLVNFIGDTIRLHFLGTTNSDTQPTVFRIDNVSLEVEIPDGEAPDVTTDPADLIGDTSARLNMTVNPNGLETTVWFDFEANDPTPNTDTDHLIVGSGADPVDVHFLVDNLDCDTLYYFEANAENSAGDDNGVTRQFRTDECETGSEPEADTDPADQITATSARLKADITPNGLSTTAWFEWGTTTALDQSTPQTSVGSGNSPVPISHTLTGLACETQYYFEAHAENSAGEDDGVTHSFVTGDCGAPPGSTGLFLWAGLQGCSGSSPAAVLGWTMPETADPVVTVRRTDGQYTAIVNTSVSGNRHIVTTGLATGSSYAFTVEASDGSETLLSNEAPVQIYSFECPLAVDVEDLPHRPRAIVGDPFCDGGTVKAVISWTTVGGANFYRLDRFEPDIAEITTFDNLTGTSFIDEGLVPGSVPTYSLKAVNAAGERESLNFSVPIPLDICSDPGDPGPFAAQASAPTCDGAGEGKVTVTWTPSSGAEDIYKIEVLDNGWHYRGSSVNTPVAGFQRVFADLRPGAVITFVVRAESTSTPGRFRQATPLHVLIPRNVCGTPAVPPTVFPGEGTYVEETQVLLNASIDPEGLTTSVYYELGTDTTYGLSTPTRAIGSGYRSIAVGEVVSGLSCGTLYHFRVVATNAAGTVLGPDRNFGTEACTGPPPTVETISADHVTQTSARLASLVNPSGVATNAWFEWGTSPTLGTVTAMEPVGSGTNTVVFRQEIQGLLCGETYYHAGKAQNVGGEASGLVLSFSTPQCGLPEPDAWTSTPELVPGMSVVLKGGVDPNGLSAVGWFEWGTTPALGHASPPVSVGAGDFIVQINYEVFDLECGETYYATTYAQSPGGTDGGALASFETSPCGFTVAFSGTPSVGVAPLAVQFTDLSSGDPNGWLWHFGDGGSSTEQNPLHIYEEPGKYTVRLLIRQGPYSTAAVENALVEVTSSPASVLPSYINLGTAPTGGGLDIRPIFGAEAGDNIASRAFVADINGDGLQDLVLSSPQTDPLGRDLAGTISVIWDVASRPLPIDLADPTLNMTRIIGRLAEDRLGISLNLGDVNDDSFIDIIAGSSTADVPGIVDGGAVYIVYGSGGLASVPVVDLATPPGAEPALVTRVYGNYQGASVGSEVTTGDVNADGVTDVVLGMPLSWAVGRQQAGFIAILFGGDYIDTIRESNIGTPFEYYLIWGANAFDVTGSSIAVGDVDGDGVEDLVFGAHYANTPGGAVAGRGYVVYGGEYLVSGSGIDLAALPGGGDVPTTLVLGRATEDFLGWDVAAADVDGDGRQEALFGALWGDYPGREDAGEVNVVWGSADLRLLDEINLGVNPSGVTRIVGGQAFDWLSYDFVAGDLSGDGRADLVLGAPGPIPQVSPEPGRAFVLHGDPSLKALSLVDVAAPPSGIALTRIDGPGSFDLFGSVISLGNVAGDRRNEILAAAPASDPLGRMNAGEVFSLGTGAGLLFADGFETGDLSAWSTVEGSP